MLWLSCQIIHHQMYRRYEKQGEFHSVVHATRANSIPDGFDPEIRFLLSSRGKEDIATQPISLFKRKIRQLPRPFRMHVNL